LGLQRGDFPINLAELDPLMEAVGIFGSAYQPPMKIEERRSLDGDSDRDWLG
jgi:hypothetical protein